MSVPVPLDALAERVEELGAEAYLVTVGTDFKAHVVSVRARVGDDGVVLGAGKTSRANAGANPGVTVLWAAPDGDPYCLIVDGQAEEAGGEDLLVRPTRAVLHRVADAPADLPSCVRIE